jgi:hypothetical protein
LIQRAEPHRIGPSNAFFVSALITNSRDFSTGMKHDASATSW